MKIQKASDLTKMKAQGINLLSPTAARITVGAATCGLSKGAGKVFEALKYEIKKQKSTAEVVNVGCNGLCYAEPIVEVIQAGKPRITYGNVTVERVGELVQSIK